jgi:hypothetical protein
MKKLLFTFVIFILTLGTTLKAQKTETPEFAFRPYILETNNKLKSLENADGKLETKFLGMGYGGAEIFYSAKLPKSTIRISKSSMPKIIVKIIGGADPSQFIKLSKAEIKKGNRKFMQNKTSFGGANKDLSDTFVKLEFKKMRNEIYEIILPSTIEIGEYGFISNGFVYCLGIE